ncbi:MAG: hypothetical protein H6Q18_766, partial [Bacteroidetes bacterium]|nr:hypothetical protein [Bacteroidota bacterium]
AEDEDAMRQQKVKEYVEKFANPFVAVDSNYINSLLAVINYATNR